MLRPNKCAPLTRKNGDQSKDKEKNAEVIIPIINGRELNNEPDQAPGRCIINFRDWSEKQALEYSEPYGHVLTNVKPVRDKNRQDEAGREKWWQFAELASGLYMESNIHASLTAASPLLQLPPST